ncbi:MAG: plasmid pRiA4b ORF-3 family protein [bacterium]
MPNILQFRIELLEISPPIWRRIQVPADSSFWDLHVAIQDAMGWTDSHLHAFELDDPKKGRCEIGIPDEDAMVPVIAGWKRKLTRHFKTPGDVMFYEYDFGDDWRHAVLLEAIALPEPGVEYPRCTAGARRCPPEDVGGVGGYEEFLEAIADPDHEEHDSYLEWCGGAFDPEEFDPAAVRFDDPYERLMGLEDDW